MIAAKYIGQRACPSCIKEITTNYFVGAEHYVWGVCPECDKVIGWNGDTGQAVPDIDKMGVNAQQNIRDAVNLSLDIKNMRKDMFDNLQKK